MPLHEDPEDPEDTTNKILAEILDRLMWCQVLLMMIMMNTCGTGK